MQRMSPFLAPTCRVVRPSACRLSGVDLTRPWRGGGAVLPGAEIDYRVYVVRLAQINDVALHMNDPAIIDLVVQRLRAEFEADLLGVLAGGSRLRGEGDANSDLGACLCNRVLLDDCWRV